MIRYGDEVSAGVALLDQTFGSDWFHRVDLVDLSMNSTRRCVVAQLVDGYFHEAWERLGVPYLDSDDLPKRSRWLVRHGLVCKDTDYHALDLTEAWRVAIRRLRANEGEHADVDLTGGAARDGISSGWDREAGVE